MYKDMTLPQICYYIEYYYHSEHAVLPTTDLMPVFSQKSMNAKRSLESAVKYVRICEEGIYITARVIRAMLKTRTTNTSVIVSGILCLLREDEYS